MGCGNMGSALAERLSKTHPLFLYDRNEEKAQHLSQQGYGKSCKHLKEAVEASEMLILAVKPQNFLAAARLIKETEQEAKLLVSLLAGTSIQTLKHNFPHAQIVRMMPNLAMIHGEGVIGLSSDEALEAGIKEDLSKIFETLGKIYWLPEEKINGLAALTGSGPAFFFVIVEAMIDAGIAMGFTAKDARELVQQMVQGGLTLLKKTPKHPGELRWQITSPQGTTIMGLKKLEELALRGAIIDTFLATYERGEELSSQSENRKK